MGSDAETVSVCFAATCAQLDREPALPPDCDGWEDPGSAALVPCGIGSAGKLVDCDWASLSVAGDPLNNVDVVVGQSLGT